MSTASVRDIVMTRGEAAAFLRLSEEAVMKAISK